MYRWRGVQQGLHDSPRLLDPVLPGEPRALTDHGGMEMAAPKGDQGPSSKAFAESNARMHAGMDIDFSGNADVDFVRGMIAHHQGAIDMARIELEYGKDPELRRLAEEIIRAQEGEIAMMKAWLEKNAK